MSKPKVAFICVHNSCRSQMAEAISKLLAAEVFDAYSAGTETKPQINPDAVRIIKQLHGVDMSLTQSSKLIEALPPVDVEGDDIPVGVVGDVERAVGEKSGVYEPRLLFPLLSLRGDAPDEFPLTGEYGDRVLLAVDDSELPLAADSEAKRDTELISSDSWPEIAQQLPALSIENNDVTVKG